MTSFMSAPERGMLKMWFPLFLTSNHPRTSSRANLVFSALYLTPFQHSTLCFWFLFLFLKNRSFPTFFCTFSKNCHTYSKFLQLQNSCFTDLRETVDKLLSLRQKGTMGQYNGSSEVFGIFLPCPVRELYALHRSIFLQLQFIYIEIKSVQMLEL